jgi:hypothetical protein
MQDEWLAFTIVGCAFALVFLFAVMAFHDIKMAEIYDRPSPLPDQQTLPSSFVRLLPYQAERLFPYQAERLLPYQAERLLPYQAEKVKPLEELYQQCDDCIEILKAGPAHSAKRIAPPFSSRGAPRQSIT